MPNKVEVAPNDHGSAKVEADHPRWSIETAIAFALARSSRDLGMVDAKAHSIRIQTRGQDYTIQQSPGLLHSARDGGTTGAMVWQTAVALADWISRPDEQNSLFARGILTRTSQVIELGCGVNPLLALTLNGRVARYIATDQSYVLKLYQANLTANTEVAMGAGSGKKVKSSASSIRDSKTAKTRDRQTCFQASQLDWEVQDISRQTPWHEASLADDSADLIIACDCVYNEHIVPAFVQACKAVCKLRAAWQGAESVLLVAQQLRAPDVYEEWTREMLQHFRMWKVRYDGHSEILSEESGFAVHLALLRGADDVLPSKQT